MVEKSSDQEPSIEEILASIRQIISDDEEETPAASASPAPEPDPEPEPASEEEDDVLELTEVVGSKPDSDPEPEDEPEPAPPPRKVEIDMRDIREEPEDDGQDSILTDTAERAALAGFSKLASRAPIDHTGTGAVTLEDIVKAMMKPMLREWLDVHLPPLIEKVVQRELQKVAKRAMDD